MNEEAIKLVEDRIEELYNSLMSKPLRVLSIFNEFFGEDKVDMQGYWSLDKFKSWLNIEPIGTYIPNDIVGIMNSEDWSIYQNWTITDLPMNQLEKVINALINTAIIERIGDSKFNNLFILVHFPSVRITNEHDKFVDINHLWAKVRILYNGTLNGGFGLNRSEYSVLHLMNNYMHSHVSDIPKSDFTRFQSPCTGSGPINGTISFLNREYDEDMWNMFCLELGKYVTVESIAGTPYHRLEELNSGHMELNCNSFVTYLHIDERLQRALGRGKLIEFIRYFINLRKLKFNYVNGSYSIGMSFIEYITLISNEFISWYNNQFNIGELKGSFDQLKERGILKECVISNGKIYSNRIRENIGSYTRFIGKKVCTFKDKEITISISDVSNEENENISVVLNSSYALYILSKILKVLNYRYGRSKASHRDYNSGTEVRYL